jgi:endonuclease-3
MSRCKPAHRVRLKAARRGTTRLERILDEIGRLLPEQTAWLDRRFQRLKDKGPFKLLIQIVLSHQTTIRVEDLAIEQVWTRFQTPRQLARAGVEDVDALIGNVNLRSTKARRIVEISRLVLERRSGSLDFLHRLPLPRALEELTSLPGVGRKTAAIVLLAVFRRPIMPVDTNILRASKALELAQERDAPDVVSENLEALLPRDPRVLARAHTHLLALGQALRRPENRWMADHLRAIR